MKENIEKFLMEKTSVVDKVMEIYLPRRYDRRSVLFELSPPRYDPNYEALNRAIAEPIWDFLDRGGKRWRSGLFLLICEALGKNPREFVDFAIIPEVIHNGTLIIDDIEDSSEFRRGKPCTYKLFGLDVAINVGSAMYHLPLLTLMKNKKKLSSHQLSRIYEIFAQEMINLSLGQATDIAWHRGLAKADEATEEQYLQMCAYKTGTLARMAAKIAAVLAEANEDFIEKIGKFAEAIGVAFQMEDDILDLVGEEFAERKGGLGQDITEGKRTLIVIHTLKKASPDDRNSLIEILNTHTTDKRLKNEAIDLMKKYGSIGYVRGIARNTVKKSWSAIEGFLPSSDAKEELKAFAEYLTERKI